MPTGADGDFDAAEPADAIVDLVYALGARYRANATFVMNSKTAGAVRKMKDADGRFLWSDGLAAGEPARLMGYPVLIAEDMPDIASGAFAIAYGDFRAGYTVAERPDLRILRDPVLGQAARALLCDQADRRRRQRLRGDQAAEICERLRPGDRPDATRRWSAPAPGRVRHTPALSSRCSSLRSGGAGVCFSSDDRGPTDERIPVEAR